MFDLYTTLDGFSIIDFDKKKIRAALRLEATPIRDLAKKAVSHRQRSDPRMNPGSRTGLLKKSIKAKVSRSGFLVAIAPFRIGRMNKNNNAFYPAYLLYGTRDGTLRPRNNYIADAFNARKDHARESIKNALENALIPRK